MQNLNNILNLNPKSDIKPDTGRFIFNQPTPGPIPPPFTQVRVVPHIGGPYIVTDGNKAAVVDHNRQSITHYDLPSGTGSFSK